MKKLIAMICMVLMVIMFVTPVSAATKDTKAPTVTKTNPEDSTADIMIESKLVVRFSEKVKKGKNFSGIIVNEQETTSIGYAAEIQDNLLIITLKKSMKYNTLYSVTVPKGAVKDKSGNSLKKDYSFQFVTEEKASEKTTSEEDGFKYKIELEGILGYELTDAHIAYFVQLLKIIGIEAEITDYYKVESR